MVPYGTDTTTPGRSPNPSRQGGLTPQQHGPPIHSMLERNSTAHSPMFGRSPPPVAAAQQSPFFGGGAGGGVDRSSAALGMGWGSSSGYGNGQSSSYMVASTAGSSSSAGNGAMAAGMGYEDLDAMLRVRGIHVTTSPPIIAQYDHALNIPINTTIILMFTLQYHSPPHGHGRCG